MRSLGYSTQQTLDMTDSLSFAFSANAIRADQAQSAMNALSKSMAKGKVDADVRISIVTGADNVIADMAKVTGKAEAKICQLGANGQISLKELIQTLVATHDTNKALVYSMKNSFADGMQTVSNAATKLLGALNQTTHARGLLAAGLGVVVDNMNGVVAADSLAAAIFNGRVAAVWVSKIKADIAAKYDFSSREQISGLPSGILSALMINESRAILIGMASY